MSINVYALGASRNIGYHACIRLMEKGATVTFLLRNTSVFDADETVQRFVSSGQAYLVKGDGLIENDVRAGWEKAQSLSPVDVVLYTIGGVPKLTLSGAVVSPVNLCASSIQTTLRVISNTTPQPKLIALSSTGVTVSSHAKLPLVMKPVYSWLIKGPHADKLGLERVLARAAGRPWDAKTDGAVPKDILSEGWEGDVEEGSYKNVLIVRPAMLTDGACHADALTSSGKPPYRVGEGDLEGGNGYTVSRKDVAHFITEKVLKDNQWEQWRGKIATIAY